MSNPVDIRRYNRESRHRGREILVTIWHANGGSAHIRDIRIGDDPPRVSDAWPNFEGPEEAAQFGFAWAAKVIDDEMG